MSLDACLIVHPYTARPDVGYGHDRYAYELLRNLPQNGVFPYVFETGFNQNIREAFLAEGKAVTRLLFQRKWGVYHATATLNGQCAITARRHPLITTIHDVLWYFVGSKYDSKLKYILKRQGIARAAQNSDLIIVPYPSTGDFLISELGIPKNRVRVVHHGVDHSKFFPLQTGEKKVRPAKFPNGKVVLFVGGVNVGKGVDTLICCFDAVVANVPDAQLVIGSKGWDVDTIRAIWERSRVKDHIHFIGFIPEEELRAAYLAADVMCFPSRLGFGLSTLEAMACGTPTVSGRTLDAPECVKDSGLMADPESPEELAHQLVRLLSDADFSREISAKGIANAAQYSWENTARKTAEIYKSLTTS